MNTPLLLPLLFVGTVIAVFAVISGLAAVYRLLRPAAVGAGGLDDGRALARAAAASRPPGDWEGQVDRSFDRMVRWSLLSLSSQQALAIVALGGAATAAVLFFVWGDWLAAGVGLILGAAAPLLVLLFLQRRWRLAIQEQLPDGLFLLARSLRAGLSLEQAFSAIRPYCTKPLVEVFGRCADQIEMGLSAPESLLRTAEATNLPDIHALASVAVLHRDVGGHLPTLIDRLAASVRERNQFRSFFRAATALSRTTAVFLAAAPPVIGCFLLYDQPELFLNFFKSSAGLLAFGAAVVLEVIGVVWLFLLLRRTDY